MEPDDRLQIEAPFGLADLFANGPGRRSRSISGLRVSSTDLETHTAAGRTDSPAEEAGFEPSVPRGCSQRVVCRFSCAPTALVDADIGRYKRVIGDALRSRTEGRQTTEVTIAVASLNRMLELGRNTFASHEQWARGADFARLLIRATKCFGVIVGASAQATLPASPERRHALREITYHIDLGRGECEYEDKTYAEISRSIEVRGCHELRRRTDARQEEAITCSGCVATSRADAIANRRELISDFERERAGKSCQTRRLADQGYRPRCMRLSVPGCL